MEKMRPPSLETTNQRMLSAENARIIYLKLRSGEINASTFLNLRPISYNLSNNGMDNGISKVRFKKWVNKTTFLEALNSIEGENMEQKKDALLPNVIWEPIDGQYIQHACTVLTHQDLLGGHFP